jgi:transposase
VGKELGLRDSILRYWEEQFEPQADIATAAHRASDTRLATSRITRLRRENERLRMVRDVPKSRLRPSQNPT